MKKPKPHINSIEPKKGLCVQIYLSRKDIGSGVRAYIIIGVSPRYVTLFYTPRLKAIKIKTKEWPHLAAQPYVCSINWLIETIHTRAREYQRRGQRMNNTIVQRTLAVLQSVKDLTNV